MMALHPKIIDLTLDRVWTLLGKLGNPQNDIPPVVHVAGTNGKGSTQAMVRAGLEGVGKSVHAYTSPHLARFHERIRLAGDLITEDHLTQVLDDCYVANDGAPITYFEITTIAAMLAFARTPADFTMMEVGLGGRLDATNIFDAPAATIITPVDMDHQAFLGDTLGQIAGEKAGIMKRDVTCIVGPQHEEALDVIEARAARVGAPLLVHGQHWHVSTERDRLIYQDETGLLDLPLPALPGPHQVTNAGAAIATLRHLGFGETAAEAAVTNVQWPARMQHLTRGALVDAFPNLDLWLDGGHNPAAGTMLARTLADLPPRDTHAICGMLRTKDVRGYMDALAPQLSSLTACSIPGEAATLTAEETADAAAAAGIHSRTAPDLQSALSDLAQRGAGRVLICGSLYFAGHVIRENG
ncbi:MAG: folylpolyglutamate synthase/dihydrofolate synthase family protein [Pseudomonadota bacterium]